MAKDYFAVAEKVRYQLYEGYLKLVRELEWVLRSGDTRDELSQARERLAYLFVERTQPFKEPAPDAVAALIKITHTMANTEPPEPLLDEFTRAEMVAFMIRKFEYWGYLWCVSLALGGVTNLAFESTRNGILTSTYFLLPRILLFVPLEQAAKEFAREFAKNDALHNWSNSMFLTLNENFASWSRAGDDLCDKYLEESRNVWL